MATSKGETIEWKVDLPALADATAKVEREAGTVKETSEKLLAVFNEIMLNWRGGSAGSFRAEVPNFRKAEQELADLLDEAVRRMKIAHATYVEAEQTNDAILKPKSGNVAPKLEVLGN